MANSLDITALPAYTDEDVNRFILLPLFTGNPDFSIYDVRQGIKSETAIQRFGSVEKITKAAVKGFTAGAGSVVDDRKVSPKRLEAEQAEDGFNLEGKILEQMLNLSADEKDNLDGTQLKDIILGIHAQGIKADAIRQLWLNDTGSADADYDVYDGFFVNYDTNLPSGQKLVFPAGAIATDGAETQFRLTFDAATNELKSNPSAILEISGSVWDNYVETLEDRGTEQADERLVNGFSNKTWRGIQIKVHREWDKHLAADFVTDGDVHRIVYHVPKAALIGTDLEGTANTKTWYDINDQEYRFRTSYVMDTQTMNDDLAVTNIALITL